MPAPPEAGGDVCDVGVGPLGRLLMDLVMAVSRLSKAAVSFFRRVINLTVGEHLGDSDHNIIRFGFLLGTSKS